MEIHDSLAIIISIISLFTSICAIYIGNKNSKESNNIAREPQVPKISISSMLFDPTKATFFGGRNVDWPGRNDFLLEQLDIIENTKCHDCKVSIPRSYEEPLNDYLLFNLCMTEKEEERVLILNALEIAFELVGPVVNQLSIKQIYSMLNPEECFEPKLIIKDADFIVKNNKVVIPIAYASWCHRTPSLNLRSIAEKINLNEEPIELSISENVDKIINFVETGYLIECKCANGYIYEYSLITERSSDGRKLQPFQIYNSRKEFDERSSEACKRAGRDVVAKRESRV